MNTRRRHLLLAAASLPLGAAQAHNDAGRVQPPQPAPALPLVLHDGRRTTLPKLLHGRATALQLMFTGCSATCPIQGAQFGEVRTRMATAQGHQLVSLSIDPLGDDPQALRGWLQRHGAGPGWSAAVPRVADVDRLLDFLRARNREPDRHTAQVYFFDRDGRLALRSTDFPSPEQVTTLLARVPAATGPGRPAA